MRNFMQPNRHILALASGILGGAFPNTMSNISISNRCIGSRFYCQNDVW